MFWVAGFSFVSLLMLLFQVLNVSYSVLSRSSSPKLITSHFGGVLLPILIEYGDKNSVIQLDLSLTCNF